MRSYHWFFYTNSRSGSYLTYNPHKWRMCNELIRLGIVEGEIYKRHDV